MFRLVTTQAKGTPERAWLAEVSAVVLQQSGADLHRAYRNYFRALDKLKAERTRGNFRAGLRVRTPRFKSRRGKQAARFTANSRFRVLPNGRLSLPKIGDVAVRWSRPLPAKPSSVTVTLDRSGRYHASFVVEVACQPLPAVQREVGVDLGLHILAALSDGTTVANPRWLCSACGVKSGPKGQAGLTIRVWTCSACAATHDRDVNAARNILAAGRAVTACRGYVSPGLVLAVAANPLGTESGTIPGAVA